MLLFLPSCKGDRVAFERGLVGGLEDLILLVKRPLLEDPDPL